MPSVLTKDEEKRRRARKDKSFWRQLGPFLFANVKGSPKKLFYAGLAAFVLPLTVMVGLGNGSRLTVEIGAYISTYVAASIALTALATEETKRNHKHVIPVLTVFTQVNTILVGVVLLIGRLNNVELT